MRFRRYLPHLLFLSLFSVAQAGRGDFDFEVGVPSKKKPIEVVLRRNPFHAGSDVERPLPVMRDKDDPAARLPALVISNLRSVVREPQALILFGRGVFQPGDEIRSEKDLLLPKHRVFLKTIERERLVLQLLSLESQQLGQVEVSVPLPAHLRRSE